MKKMHISRIFIIVIVIFIKSCKSGGDIKKETQSKTDISEFLGQWAIDITPRGVGWLEVRQEDGYLDADLLWQGGSGLPVIYIYLTEWERYTVVLLQSSVQRNLPVYGKALTLHYATAM